MRIAQYALSTTPQDIFPLTVIASLSKTGVAIPWAHYSSFKEKKIGAGNGIRTRDPHLGKVMLYH